MLDVTPILHSLLLLLTANGAPIVARKLFAQHLAWPVDAGHVAGDGQPLFGVTKTWRGVVASVVATSVVALLIGITWHVGAMVALLAMAGDLFSSFIKRRLMMSPSSRATGLDQIPESLLPVVLLRHPLSLDWLHGTVVVVLFVVLEIGLSKILYRLHIRQRPY